MTISELDKESILAVLTGVYEAWDTGDADAFVANYLADASAILPGFYRTSRDEIRDAMTAGSQAHSWEPAQPTTSSTYECSLTTPPR